MRGQAIADTVMDTAPAPAEAIAIPPLIAIRPIRQKVFSAFLPSMRLSQRNWLNRLSPAIFT